MEKKYVLGILALAMVAIIGTSMVSAFGLGKGISEEDKTTLKNAMETDDYEAWKEIKRSQISEDKFKEKTLRFQERAEFRAAMQQARESGDYSRVQELKEEFGCNKDIEGKQQKNKNCDECPFAK